MYFLNSGETVDGRHFDLKQEVEFVIGPNELGWVVGCLLIGDLQYAN